MKSRSFWRFFFNDTATAEIYTLSLHDALPICLLKVREIAAAGKKREVSRPGTLQRRDARRRGLRGPHQLAVRQGGDLPRGDAARNLAFPLPPRVHRRGPLGFSPHAPPHSVRRVE